MQRAAHHILVTALVHKELDCCYYLLALLNFVEENQSFPWNQWFFSEGRQSQQQIFCSLLLAEQFDGIGLFYEIDFYNIVKTLLTDLPDGKGLANLSGSCYQQRTSVVEYKVAY